MSTAHKSVQTSWDDYNYPHDLEGSICHLKIDNQNRVFAHHNPLASCDYTTKALKASKNTSIDIPYKRCNYVISEKRILNCDPVNLEYLSLLLLDAIDSLLSLNDGNSYDYPKAVCDFIVSLNADPCEEWIQQQVVWLKQTINKNWNNNNNCNMEMSMICGMIVLYTGGYGFNQDIQRPNPSWKSIKSYRDLIVVPSPISSHLGRVGYWDLNEMTAQMSNYKYITHIADINVNYNSNNFENSIYYCQINICNKNGEMWIGIAKENKNVVEYLTHYNVNYNYMNDLNHDTKNSDNDNDDDDDDENSNDNNNNKNSNNDFNKNLENSIMNMNFWKIKYEWKKCFNNTIMYYGGNTDETISLYNETLDSGKFVDEINDILVKCKTILEKDFKFFDKNDSNSNSTNNTSNHNDTNNTNDNNMGFKASKKVELKVSNLKNELLDIEYRLRDYNLQWENNNVENNTTGNISLRDERLSLMQDGINVWKDINSVRNKYEQFDESKHSMSDDINKKMENWDKKRIKYKDVKCGNDGRDGKWHLTDLEYNKQMEKQIDMKYCLSHCINGKNGIFTNGGSNNVQLLKKEKWMYLPVGVGLIQNKMDNNSETDMKVVEFYQTGDVIGIWFDLNNGVVRFFKNKVLQGECKNIEKLNGNNDEKYYLFVTSNGNDDCVILDRRSFMQNE